MMLVNFTKYVPAGSVDNGVIVTGIDVPTCVNVSAAGETMIPGDADAITVPEPQKTTPMVIDPGVTPVPGAIVNTIVAG